MFFRNWSLKAKVTSVILCSQVLGLGALGLGAGYTVMHRFLALEAREVGTNAARLAEALQEKMSGPAAKIPDWANWDDTFKYAQDANKAYESTNLIPGTLDNLQVDSLRLFKLDGKALFTLNRDSNSMGYSPGRSKKSGRDGLPTVSLPCAKVS